MGGLWVWVRVWVWQIRVRQLQQLIMKRRVARPPAKIEQGGATGSVIRECARTTNLDFCNKGRQLNGQDGQIANRRVTESPGLIFERALLADAGEVCELFRRNGE